jgi:hypothetical protein
MSSRDMIVDRAIAPNDICMGISQVLDVWASHKY